MAIDSKFYMHESDKAALQALQAVPGFSQLFKAFMKIWNEKFFRIENMSSNLQITEKQLSKYYNMLPPICEKLGIEVPELYIKQDVYPNAYTYGDTNPFIVITTGLLETVPEDLVPTVLAHECGHIACHHTLFNTIAHTVLEDATSLMYLLGIDGAVMLPIRAAFYYWKRCSEFSADRAAVIYDGNADNTIRLMMYFAGYDKDIDAESNVEEFMNQALAYKEMLEDSKWDKSMEYLYMWNHDHPLVALRAYECNEWMKTERAQKIVEYVETTIAGQELTTIEFLKELPVTESSKAYIGKSVDEVVDEIHKLGFADVRKVKTTKKTVLVKEGQVVAIFVNSKEGFEKYEWYPMDSVVEVEFYEAETEEEIALAHPGQKRIPNSTKRYLNKGYEEVILELQNAGFANIETECQKKGKKNLLSKEGAVAKISIGGQTQFEKGEWFAEEALIRITYFSYEE